MKDGDSKPGVKKNLRVYPLNQAASPPEMKFVNISGNAFNTIGPGNYSLFEYVNSVIQNEPSDAGTLTHWVYSPPSGSRKANLSHPMLV
jgi:hypothetical protein